MKIGAQTSRKWDLVVTSIGTWFFCCDLRITKYVDTCSSPSLHPLDSDSHIKPFIINAKMTGLQTKISDNTMVSSS